MPPCAATVCERVGNTLDSTATLRPACASCSEQRIPAPPAPTITASKRRRASLDAAAMDQTLQRICTDHTAQNTSHNTVSVCSDSRTQVGFT